MSWELDFSGMEAFLIYFLSRECEFRLFSRSSQSRLARCFWRAEEKGGENSSYTLCKVFGGGGSGGGRQMKTGQKDFA